ncbi:MAG: zf-HC2 domain-containing protein [Lachnospiraceae bacterium]|nr:zf-HC2 domain-containing protein [Lachnospiraceae bacterium]
MNENCGVVGDLLPLYHDGVCSEESRKLVEDHLSHCQRCRAVLDGFDDDRNSELWSEGQRDDLKPLKKINQTVRKGKRKAALIGVGITLGVMTVLFGAYNIWWYTQCLGFYQQFALGHELLSMYAYDENGNRIPDVKPVVINDKLCCWEDETYQYEVRLPEYLDHRNGQVSVKRLDNEPDGYSIRLYIERGSEHEYEYHVSIMVSRQEDMYEYFILDPQLNQLYLEHWDVEFIERQNEIFLEYQGEVMELIEAAKAMWSCLE